MTRQQLLAMAQENAADEIVSFIEEFVPPEKRIQALMKMASVLKHYETTFDFLAINQ